jgi:hypothetical protein
MQPGAAGALALCAGLAAFSGRVAASERPAVRLPVVIVSLADNVDPLALAVMTEEARAILGAVGAEVTWTRDEPTQVRPDEVLYVVLLGGTGVGADAGRGVLGATLAGPASASSSALWVYYNNVARGVGLRPENISAASHHARRDLGVALGRVVVHEIVHLLVPELEHAPAGLMCSRMGRRVLRYPHVALDAETRELLHERAAIWPHHPEPEAATSH